MGEYLMKKFTVGLMTATAFVATPTLANDGEFYLGLGSGVTIAETIDLEEQVFNNPVKVETDLGWEVEALLGYDAGPVRFEVEGSYRELDIDTIDAGSIVGIPGFTTPNSFIMEFGVQISSATIAD
jgi:hypothetical protein